MNLSNRTAAILYALGFLTLGAVFNSWSINRVFFTPGPNNFSLSASVTGVFQTLVILGGIAWVASGSFFCRYQSNTWIRGLLLSSVCLGLLLTAVSIMAPQTIQGSQKTEPSFLATRPTNRLQEKLKMKDDVQEVETYHVIENVFVSEELVIRVAPELSKLSVAAQNLRFPDDRSRSVFWEQAEFRGILESNSSSEYVALTPVVQPAATGEPPRLATSMDNEKVASQIDRRFWGISPEILDPGEAMWSAYFQDIDYFDYAKFYVVTASFDLERTTWNAKLGFSGLAKTCQGQWQSVRATIDTQWRQADDADEPVAGWKIASWSTRDFQTESSANRMFRNVLRSALPDPSTRATAQRSIHQEHVVQQILLGKEFPPPYQPFFFAAFEDHPGLAVVDVNQDGFDDIYLMSRLGTNQFFLNQGDGTFREAAEELGLAISDHCSCAVFFDGDNDGDPDVFIGRTLKRSLYLVNDHGKYVRPKKSKFLGSMPRNVSSATVADYDNDGQLDLYVSTYCMTATSSAGFSRRQRRAKNNVGADTSALGKAPAPDKNVPSLINRTGPPNFLFHNVGDGKFETIRKTNLAIERLTFQSAWCDFDNDLDQDLFCANDFGPDYLFRNDGQGKFTDVTDEQGLALARSSLSMGISWADYDNDDTMDLYISGMYSKAGKRVLNGIEGEDDRLMQAAAGSTLFRGGATRFEPQLDGAERKAGWSWGGQFADVDNDADQDIYIVSGYYTAPAALALPGDG